MKEKTGNRIIQIILLIIIVAGIAAIVLTMRGGGSGSGMPGGRPGGMPAGGPPGGFGGFGGGSDNAPSTIAVEAEIVERGTVSQYILVNGDVVSDVSVDIYPDVSGTLVEKLVDVGDYVKKGEVIGVVDPSVPGVVYSKSNIVSTISGTVTEINVSVGDKVNASSSTAVIGDLANLSIVTYVPERFITYLKTGLVAEVAFEAFPDRSFNAKVIQLDPVVDTDSRSLEIKLEILQPDSRIRAGMFASMKLVIRESRNCLSVLNTAVLSYYTDSIVYVLNDDNTVEKRVITTGLTSNERVEILTGLKEGDIVITQGTSSLVDGTPVRVVNDLENGGE